MNSTIERNLIPERDDGLIPTNWWVVTGGPNSGKSTLLDLLAKRGYQTTEEAARSIINEDMDRGRTLEQIRSKEMGFQERVLIRKEEIEESLNPKNLVFLDRGMGEDTFAYTALHDLIEKEKNLNKPVQLYPWETIIVELRRYKGVFLLDSLPYQKDYARTEDDYEARMVNPLLNGFYRKFGYEPTIVPVLPKKERIQFILDHVRSVEPTAPMLPPSDSELAPEEYQPSLL